MALRSFVRRECLRALRRGSLYRDRLGALAVVLAIVAGFVGVWDWSGWERASVAGSSVFGRSAFGAIIVAQVSFATAVAAGRVARAIPSERDGKSLDSLLATPVSAAEVVLGAMAAGLFRYANGLAATLPVVVLVVYLGGIDPGFAWLVGAGVVSTAFVLAAVAVAASVVGRSGVRAVAMSASLIGGWLLVPFLIATLKAIVWPGGPRWITPAALWWLDSSPFGVAAHLTGLVTRPGSLVERIVRMIVLQVVGGSALIAWAIWRLRPASRALHDDEVRIATLRVSRAEGRRRPRAPCGDDPVLWNERYADRGAGGPLRWTRRLSDVVSYALLAWGTSWFAGPAFAELAERGFGPAREAFVMPEENPFARVIVGKLIMPSGETAPGQARLVFNIVLRQLTGFFAALFVVTIAATAAARVAAERDRDTWLGLIATPLSGWEIVRAKMLGAVWKAREVAFLLIALWTVGLLAGAVHPLGFLGALALLAASGSLFAALGVGAALRQETRGESHVLIGWQFSLVALSGLVVLLPGRLGVWLGCGSVPYLGWASLFSYEDVHAAIHAAPFPQFSRPSGAGPGARLVLAVCGLGMLAHAAGAVILTRALCRRFDVLVGRPTRPRGEADAGQGVRNRLSIPDPLASGEP